MDLWERGNCSSLDEQRETAHCDAENQVLVLTGGITGQRAETDDFQLH